MNATPQSEASTRAVGAAPGETLHGARPAWLDALSANAVSSLVLAAFVTGAALFRGQLSQGQFDLIASLLRTFAVTFWVRALLALGRAARAWYGDRVAARSLLKLTDQSLSLTIGARHEQVTRDDVLGVTYQEPLPSRTLAPRAPDVLLVLRPAQGAPRVLAIPPYFAPSAEVLSLRLKRWLNSGTEGPAEPARTPTADPEQRYRGAAQGRLGPGDVVIPEARGYLLRAPYAALLGLLFSLDVVSRAGALRHALLQPSLAAAALCVAMMVAWLAWMQRRRRSRLGMGMLLTREELLVRGPAGVVSVPWPQLLHTEIKLQPRWSPFVGPYAARRLTLTTQDQQQLLFDGSFLGVPVEVVVELCSSLRRGQLGTAKPNPDKSS